MVESLCEFYHETACQRCAVRFDQNVLQNALCGNSNHVAAILKAAHAQKDDTTAREKAAAVVKKLRSITPAAAVEWFEASISET